MDVCVTADDYGLSPGVNAAIEGLAAAGKLSAVSAMAHRDAQLGSLRRLGDAGVAVGLHLCFTAERPVLGAQLGRALGGAGERLPRSYRSLFAALLRRPSLVASLRAEAAAQAERLLDAGARIAFVNGHEHVHLWPLLWPIVVELARRLGARAVRCALGQPLDLSAAGALSLVSRASWITSPLRGSFVLSPLGVGLAGGLSIERIERLLARPFAAAPGRAREICVHPALDVAGRRAEHEMLASGQLDRLLERMGLDRSRIERQLRC